MSKYRAAGRGSRAWKRKRDAVIERDGNKCVHCGEPGDVNTLTVDHIVSKRRGGKNDTSNLRSLCLPCHVDVTEHFLHGFGWINRRGMRLLAAEALRARTPLPVNPAHSLLMAQYAREVHHKHTGGGERRRD